MKALIFFAALVFVGSMASAQSISECRRTCSSSCMQLAESLIQEARDIQSNCETGGPVDGDVVTACKQHFYTTQDRLTCTQTAKDAQAVGTCTFQFATTQDRLQCVAGARNSEIVSACVLAFATTSDRMECIRRARSEAIVRNCVNSYYTTEDRLNCIGR